MEVKVDNCCEGCADVFAYEFDVSRTVDIIKTHWTKWNKMVKCNKIVVGISGGIDSTTVAALACRFFGKENVIGISMPCDVQRDMNDVNKVFDHLGIRRIDINIGDPFHNIIESIENNSVEVSNLTSTNLPARLRMATLYAVSQSIPGSMVMNTCNLSESVSGYDTLFGDDCGSYAPIQELTKTEVREVASFIGVPDELVYKIPIDGLQGNTDEENFGYTYATLDSFIRTGRCHSKDIEEKIINRYVNSGWFKMKMITIDGPKFDLPNFIPGCAYSQLCCRDLSY